MHEVLYTISYANLVLYNASLPDESVRDLDNDDDESYLGIEDFSEDF